MEFAVAPEEWVEDSPDVGQWSKVMVVAKSDGWKLDQAILDTLLQATGVAGKYQSWLKYFDPDGFLQRVTGFLRSKAVGKVIQASAGGSGLLEIPAEETSPIDVTAEPWTEATYHFAFAEVDRQRFQLNPEWTGEVVGKVRITTNPAHFAGRTINESWEVEIPTIRVMIDPDAVVVEPGEVVDFDVEVLNADDPSIEATVLNGTIVSVTDLGEGRHRVRYRAPSEKEGLPDSLTVRSLTATGMYASGERPAPVGQAMIRGDQLEVEIEPLFACVKSETKETFRATVHGSDDQTVIWTTTAGSISRSGVFTAPSGSGSATVTATSVADPSVSVSAEVAFGRCDCNFTTNIGLSTTYGGIHLAGEDMFMLQMMDGSEDGDRLMAIIFEEPVSGPGSYSVNGTGRAGPGNEFMFTSEASPLTIDLRRFERTADGILLEGSVSGTIYWQLRGGKKATEHPLQWPAPMRGEFTLLTEQKYMYTCGPEKRP